MNLKLCQKDRVTLEIHACRGERHFQIGCGGHDDIAEDSMVRQEGRRVYLQLVLEDALLGSCLQPVPQESVLQGLDYGEGRSTLPRRRRNAPIAIALEGISGEDEATA